MKSFSYKTTECLFLIVLSFCNFGILTKSLGKQRLGKNMSAVTIIEDETFLQSLHNIDIYKWPPAELSKREDRKSRILCSNDHFSRTLYHKFLLYHN